MKIGILGGTFNPIHSGHIKMAEFVAGKMELDKICFLPNGQPPHKNSNTIADKHHRLQMVKIAIADYDNFYVSDYEINREGNCYTIDTIKHFKSADDNDYYFIIGADSLFQLDKWKNADELKKICNFIVCDRGGSGDTMKEVERLKKSGCRIWLTDMPLIDIDSTSIRDKIKNGKDISDFVPKRVQEYIDKNNLYIGGRI